METEIAQKYNTKVNDTTRHYTTRHDTTQTRPADHRYRNVYCLQPRKLASMGKKKEKQQQKKTR